MGLFCHLVLNAKVHCHILTFTYTLYFRFDFRLFLINGQNQESQEFIPESLQQLSAVKHYGQEKVHVVIL